MKRIVFFLPAWLLLMASAISGSPTNSVPLRVALLSDIHIMRGTNTSQIALHQKHFEQAIAGVNAANVDLVLMAGDLTEHGTAEEFADLKKFMRGLKAPVWVVPGNHDIGNKFIRGKEEKKEEGVNPARIALYERKLGPSFYEREFQGVRVIGFNTPVCGTDFKREKKMWAAMEQYLGQPAAKPTLLLLHFPVYVKEPNEPGGVYWNLEPFPRQRLLSLARQGGVKAVLSGHTHTESMKRRDGVLYVTAPPVSFGLPRGKQKEGWVLLTVTSEGEVTAEFQYLKK